MQMWNPNLENGRNKTIKIYQSKYGKGNKLLLLDKSKKLSATCNLNYNRSETCYRNIH